MWDSTEVLNIVGSVGILVTAIGAVIVNIIVAMRTGKRVQESLDNQVKISNQVAEVHTITNSNLSAVKAELKQATMQIEEMKTFVRDLKGERDKLAVLTAHTTKALPETTTKESEVLEEIEENTKNTDMNTRKILKEKK